MKIDQVQAKENKFIGQNKIVLFLIIHPLKHHLYNKKKNKYPEIDWVHSYIITSDKKIYFYIIFIHFIIILSEVIIIIVC